MVGYISGQYGSTPAATYPKYTTPAPAKPSGKIPAQDNYNQRSRLQALRGIDQQFGGALSGNTGMMFPDLYVNAPGYDNSGAIRALYDSLRSKGTEIYGKTQGTLKDIYGNLRAAYAPLEENTRTRYNTAIESTGTAKSTGDAEAQMRAGAEDAARREMMARMGIASQADTGSGGASVDMARETGGANRAALQQNWEALMGSMSAAQQGRDASSLRGATDQETMALEELATRWSDYQNELAQRQAQAMQGARGGGGMQLNPAYQGLPELAQMARMQQFANQTGMPLQQVMSIMNPAAQDAVDPQLQEFFFNSAADRAAAGGGGQKEWDALQARNSGLTGADWAKYYG